MLPNVSLRGTFCVWISMFATVGTPVVLDPSTFLPHQSIPVGLLRITMSERLRQTSSAARALCELNPRIAQAIRTIVMPAKQDLKGLREILNRTYNCDRSAGLTRKLSGDPTYGRVQPLDGGSPDIAYRTRAKLPI